jgi:hypothetical protein
MKPILYTGNLAERGAVTGGAIATNPVTRLADGDIGLSWISNVSGTLAVYLDLGVGIQGTANAWLLPTGHNLAGIVCILSTATTLAGPWTDVSTVTPASSALIRASFTSATSRCWALSLLNTAQVPSITEWVIAKSLTLPSGPQEPQLVTGTLGNVQSYDSLAGYTWTRKKGPPRWEGTYLIRDLTLAQRGDLEAAFTASDEGARPFFLEDADGILRWVYWLTDGGKLAFQAEGITRWRVTLQFREGL